MYSIRFIKYAGCIFTILFFWTCFQNRIIHHTQLKEEYITLHVASDNRVKVNIEFVFSGFLPAETELAFPENDTVTYKNFRFFDGAIERPVFRQLPPPGRLFDFGVDRYQSVYRYTTAADRKGIFLHTVTYEYAMPFYFAGGEKSADSPGRLLHYIIRTGALWDKRIDKLVAEINLKGIFCSNLHATPRSLQGKCVSQSHWKHTSYNREPLNDIEIYIDKTSQINHGK